MTGHRHSTRKAKADKPPTRKQAQRKQKVSLADRLEPAVPPSVDGSVLPGGGAPRSRKAAREQRKQQARNRRAVGTVAIIALVLLGALAVWWFTRDEPVVEPPPDLGR
ncbi:MAG: hypothetical protein ABI586_07880, partial [Candidatus Nanopelagicales bacterium]